MQQRRTKTARAQNARFASATTCSFGIKPRSSLRLIFWRDTPEPSHIDFSTLSDPAALTAPHCVQKNSFSWPCNRASWWLTCIIQNISHRCELALQNGLCGFVTDFWLRHKFAPRNSPQLRIGVRGSIPFFLGGGEGIVFFLCFFLILPFFHLFNF